MEFTGTGKFSLGDAPHGPSTPSTTWSSRGIYTPSTCSSSPSVSQVSHYSDIPVLPLPDILEETGGIIMRHNIGQHKVVASTFLRIASMLPAEDKARLSISCKLFQEHLNSYQWWSVDEAANPCWVPKFAILGARLERLAKLEHGCTIVTWDKEPEAPNVIFSNDGRTASREVSTDCHYAVVVSAEPMRSFSTECFSTKGGRYSRYCEIRMGTILRRLVGKLVVGITWRSPDSIGQGRLPAASKLKERFLLPAYDYNMLQDGTLGVFLAPNGDVLVFNNRVLLSHEKDKVPTNVASEFWLVLEVPAFTATLSEVDHLPSGIIAAAFPAEERWQLRGPRRGR